MGITISGTFSSEREIENEVKNLKRALTFMADESAMRNTVTRLHLMLSKIPNEYAIEYGPSTQFVLPATSELETTVTGVEEEAQKKKAVKELNQNFSRLTEFQDSNSELNSNVKIIGVGNSQSNILQMDGEISVYSFPSGEKDEVIIILASESELASVETSAFNAKIDYHFHKFDTSNEKDPLEAQQKKAKEIFDEWKKDHH